MPCPSGVNIQYIFYLDILYNVYDCKSYAASSYQNILKNYDKATLDWSGKPATCCVECGLCETKCPQKIKIIEQLKKSSATLTKNCVV
jgi:predicted aldo/keto reductase-like oxidoreductase